MRAVRVVRHARPIEAIEVQDIEVPAPGPGEVRVAVRAASLNFGDIARCRGTIASVMAPPPYTLGMDVAGIVEAAGAGAEDLIGRRVVAVTNQSLGGMADAAIAARNGVFEAPSALDDVEAAAFTLPFHTGYLAVNERARLAAGETLLVIGAASAVGTAVIQLGVAAGARVIAVAGGPDKVALCRSLGAEFVVDHQRDDLWESVMGFTDGRGVDVACDMVGGDGTETVWTCMAHSGRYVPVGFNDDAQSGMTGRPLRRVSMGNFSVVGVVMGYSDAPAPLRRFGFNPFPPHKGPVVQSALVDLIDAGSIRPYVGRRISFDEVAQTLEDHDQRRTMGRSVLDCSRA